MIRRFSLLALLVPVAALAQSPEMLRGAADVEFAAASAMIHASIQKAVFSAAQGTFFQAPLKARPLARFSGEELARVGLAAQLDRNLHVLNARFGARPLDVGLACEANNFKNDYLSFSDAKTMALGALGDLNRLRNEGIDIRIDAKTVYHFHVSINIFDPIRGSTLEMTPTQGTTGPSTNMKTGTLLDAVRARSTVFSIDGQEYWILYGHDVKAGGDGFADTRSFLFIKIDGLSSKAWPLAESSLKVDAPSSVDLGGTGVTVTLTSGGELVVSGQ